MALFITILLDNKNYLGGWAVAHAQEPGYKSLLPICRVKTSQVVKQYCRASLHPYSISVLSNSLLNNLLKIYLMFIYIVLHYYAKV